MVFVLYIVLSLFLGPVIAGGVVFFIEPVVRSLHTAVAELAAPICGALAALVDGLTRAEHVVRRLLVESGRSLVCDDATPERDWALAKIVRPFVAFVTFVYLAVVDFYLAALAFAVLFKKAGDLPNLHLNLPILMGLLWPGVAIAWTEGLTEAAAPKARGPYAFLPARLRRVAVVLLATGVVTTVLGNMAFFLWRQGQVGTTNPIGWLSWVVIAALGLLSAGGLIVTALSGLPILAGIVPLLLAPIDLVLLVAVGAVASVRAGFALTLGFAELVLEALLSLSGRLQAGFKASAQARREAAERRREAAERLAKLRAGQANAQAEAARVQAEQAELDRAEREREREQVRLARERELKEEQARKQKQEDDFQNARLAKLLAEPRRPTIAEQIFAGIGAAVRTVWHAIVALAGAIGRSIAASGMLVLWCVELAVKVIAFALLWLFSLFPRVLYTFWSWVCRFPFCTNTLRFKPFDENDPPRVRFMRRAEALNIPLFRTL